MPETKVKNSKTKANNSKVGFTTYLLEMSDHTQRKITIPSPWKVTFGPLMPGSRSLQENSGGATALRVYEGTIQRAAITNVKAFRDMSIVIEERITKTEQETYVKDTPTGAKAVVVEAVVHHWQNPDAPQRSKEANTNGFKRLAGNKHSRKNYDDDQNIL